MEDNPAGDEVQKLISDDILYSSQDQIFFH